MRGFARVLLAMVDYVPAVLIALALDAVLLAVEVLVLVAKMVLETNVVGVMGIVEMTGVIARETLVRVVCGLSA